MRRSVHHGLILTAVSLTVLLCGTVLSALTALASTSLDAGAVRRLAAAPGAQVVVTADFRAPGVAAADRAVRASVGRVFGDLPQHTYLGLLSTAPVFVAGVDGNPGTPLGAGVAVHPAAVQGAARFGRLTAGGWPAGVGGDVSGDAFTALPTVQAATGTSTPVQAAVPQQLAQRLHLTPGSTLQLSDAFNRPLTVRITGVYRAADGAVGFWPGMAGAPTGDTGDEQNLLLVAPTTLNGSAALNGKLLVHWDAVPDFSHLDASDLAGLRDRSRAFSGSRTGLSVFHGSPPALENLTAVSGLPQAVDALAVPTVVARSALYTPTALLAALALTALALTARQLTVHRRGEAALQRARGAGTLRLLRAAAAEWAVTGIPAAVAAPFLAGLLQPGALGGGAWAAVGLTLLVYGASVLLPELPPLGHPLRSRVRRGARGVRGARAAAQRVGADAALLAVAVLGYLELRRDRPAAVGPDAGNALTVDPVLVLVPVLASGAAALLLLRLLPWTSRLLDAAGRRGRSLVLPLAGWQLSRRSARNAAPVVLMFLAVSVGSLATTALACLDGLAVDQAAFRVGADVSVDADGAGDYPATVLRSAYAALPGVTAVTPVTRTSANEPGGVGAELVGTVSGPAPSAPLGVVLPGRPSALLIEETLSSDGATVAPWLELTLQDASGLVSTVSAALPPATGARQLVRAPLQASLGQGSDRAFPLTLTAVTVRPQSGTRPARLNLVLHRIGSATGAASTVGTGGTAWAGTVPAGLAWADRTAFAADAAAGACRGSLDDRYVFGAPGVCAITAGGADLLAVGISTGYRDSSADAGLPGSEPVTTLPGARLTLVLAPTGPGGPLPVRADAAALRDGHLAVGRSVKLDLGTGAGLAVTVVGTVDTVPGLGRGQGHLLVDQRRLAAAMTVAGIDQRDPTLWWLSSGDSARTAAGIAAQPALGNGTTRAQVAADQRADPFRSGLRKVLELSRLLAPCFAVVGFTVHAVISTRARRTEFALLRALGVRSGTLSGLLGAEQLSTALFALVPGALTGVALAAAVLPQATVDDSGRPPYPALRLVLPWASVALTALITVAAICLVGVALSRLLARVDLVRVLRAGEGE